MYCFLLFRQTEHQLKARTAQNLHFAACFFDTLTQHGKASALNDFSLWRRAVVGQGNLHAVRLLQKEYIQFCAIRVTDTVCRTFADRQCAQCAYPLPLRRIPCHQNADAQFFRSFFRRLQRFGLRRYVGGLFEVGFEAGFPAWLRETNEAMLHEYPFIAEIDEEHIIGGAGHLYCIVPVDENATVAINRVQWNEKTQTDEVTEVLYRSESGEPVLLFANLDGVAYEADTQVFITDNNGNTCEWYPSFDAMSHLAPCISEAGDYLSFDFTEYAWYNASAEFSAWLADGWSGMTALGLAGSQRDGMGWITETMVGETSRYAYFSLRFYPEDETGGTVDLNWVYEDSDEFEEMWSGFWTIQTIPDGPSYVTLSLSLVGGKNYGVKEVRCICVRRIPS